MHFLLLYEYVPGMAERRAPFREAHLRLGREWVDRGEIACGGAFPEALDGAALVFRTESRARVEEFVRQDPYAANGLVTAWKVRQWAIVLGTAP